MIPVAAFPYPIEHRCFCSRNIASAVGGGLERCVPGSRGPHHRRSLGQQPQQTNPRPSDRRLSVHALPVGSVHEPARKDAGHSHVSLLEPLQVTRAGAITNLFRP